MLVLKLLEVISASHQIAVDGVSLPLYLLAEVFFLSQLAEKTFFLFLEPVEFFPQLLV